MRGCVTTVAQLVWLKEVRPEELGAELRLAVAVNLYELGRIFSGAAAKLAGIPRTLFLTKLADYGVDTFRLNEQELRQEGRLAEIICNTSPLQYLHQLRGLHFLPALVKSIATSERRLENRLEISLAIPVEK